MHSFKSCFFCIWLIILKTLVKCLLCNFLKSVFLVFMWSTLNLACEWNVLYKLSWLDLKSSKLNPFIVNYQVNKNGRYKSYIQNDTSMPSAERVIIYYIIYYILLYIMLYSPYYLLYYIYWREAPTLVVESRLRPFLRRSRPADLIQPIGRQSSALHGGTVNSGGSCRSPCLHLFPRRTHRWPEVRATLETHVALPSSPWGVPGSLSRCPSWIRLTVTCRVSSGVGGGG